MPSIDATATSSAPREAVWAELEDPARWSQWGPWSDVHVEGGAAHGPGAVRVLKMPALTLREEVTGWEPGRSMGYRVLDGLNVTGYEATVTLDDAPGGGTTISWRATYERAGFFTKLLLGRAVRDVPKRVAKAAAGNPR